MTLLRVIMFVLVVLVKMGTGIMPAFLSLVSSVYEFHRTQLTVIDLVFEFIFVSLMLIMLVYSKEILDYIWQIEVKLERSSKEATRKAMRIAPHISFFTLSFIFSLLGRKIFKPLSHERVLPLFSLVLPVLRTVYGSLLMPTNPQGQLSSGALTPTVSSSATIGRKKMDESALREMDADDLERIAASGRRTILLWIVLAMYHAIATVLTHMPFMGRLRFFFPFLRELVLVVLLWAQMNPLFIEIVYEATSPILVKAASFIPSSSAEEERGLAILSFLKSMKVINESTEAFFRALCVESTSFLLIILFVFVPSPSHIFAHVGLVILSLILPSIRAAAVVAQWETPSVRRESEGDRGRSRRRGSHDSRSGGIAQAGGRCTSMPSMAERGRDMLDHISRTLSLGGLMGRSGGKLGESGDDGDYTSGATPTSRSPAQRDCTFTVGVLTTGRKIRKGSDTTSSIILRQKRWLEYFTCIAIVWLLRCHGIFLWPSVGMLLAWYLSHSLWAGARPLSRYLVKLARLGMVMLTPIILFRMTRQLVGLAVTISTPRRDQEHLSSGGTRPHQDEDGDPRLVRLRGEGEENEDNTGTPFVQGATGQPSNSGAGNGLLQRSGSGRKKGTGSGHEMSPFDMDEDDDDGEVPTPGSLSMSTPGLYEHCIADISGTGIRGGPSPESFRIPDCVDSSQRAGRTAEVEIGAEEGDTRASDGAGPVGARSVGRARRRSNSKTRK